MTGTDRKPLSRFAIEVAVVVGSILLAFAIQAWWDDRGEQRLRQVTLEGLLADFEAAEPVARGIRAAHQAVLAGNEAVIDLLRSAEGQSRVPVADTLLLALFGTPTYNPPRASVELALATGRMNELEDEPLRRLLAEWLTELDDTAEDEIEATTTVESRIVPLLVATPGLEDVLPHAGPWLFEQLPDSIATSSHPVERSDELAGLLAVRISHTRRAVQGMTRLVELQRVISDSLRAAVDRR